MVLVFHFHFHFHLFLFSVIVILLRITGQDQKPTANGMIFVAAVVANAEQRIFQHVLWVRSVHSRDISKSPTFLQLTVSLVVISLGHYPVSFQLFGSVSDYLRTLLRIRLRYGTDSMVLLAPSISNFSVPNVGQVGSIHFDISVQYCPIEGIGNMTQYA